MEKIASFTIDHLRLEPGVYLSRVDHTPCGDAISTYDIRFTAPNRETPVDGAVLHTVEHLAATWLRNNPVWRNRVVYWGPMGCRTGSYLLLSGEYTTREVAALMEEMFRWIATFRGDIPGATPRDCGDCTYNNLEGANRLAAQFVDNVLSNIDALHLNYPGTPDGL